MAENMTKNERVNEELENVTDFTSNGEVTTVESTADAVVNTVKEEGNLVKEVGEIMIVGVIIYGFCKLCDFVIDKIKSGVQKLKEKRAAKKAAKVAQQQVQAQVAQVATQVANVATQTIETVQQQATQQ